jgi:hypothetical protein
MLNLCIFDPHTKCPINISYKKKYHVKSPKSHFALFLHGLDFIKPQSQLAVCASTGGLRAFFSKYRAGHARTPYDFYGSYGSRKYVRWLLDMHNNRYGFLALSINVRYMCASHGNHDHQNPQHTYDHQSRTASCDFH